VHGLQFPAVKLEVRFGLAVLEVVGLDGPAGLQHDSRVSSAQSPMTWKS
jgi:hypothetical protein